MKNYFLLLLCCIPFIGKSQSVDPKKSINKINEKFSKVADYKADVAMQFGIPNVKISNINATVLYKNPNKFKMKAKGLYFLPKQNPMQNVMNTLKDTANYQAIYSGKALVNGTNCIIVNIIPIKPMGDLVLGKFWIDDVKNLIVKSEITTKNNGTVATENKFGANAIYALPDEIKINMDVNKFKIPKMLALDINKKKKLDANPNNKKESASITLHFTNYIINQKIEDREFTTD